MAMPGQFDPMRAAQEEWERKQQQPPQEIPRVQRPLDKPYDPMDAAAGLVDPLGLSIRQGMRQASDRAQRILQLRAATGLPPEVIEQDFDRIDQQVRAGAFDPEDLQRTSPAVAQWLQQNRMNPASVSTPDELSRIRSVERQFQWADPMLRSIDNMQGSAYGWVEALGEFTGTRGFQQFGREGRERNRLEALAYGQGASLTTAFDSPSDFGFYVYNVVGEQVPVMGLTMSSAAAGAAAGAAIGTIVPGIGNVVGGTIGGIIGAFVPSWVMGVGEVQQNIKELDPSATAPTWALLGGTAIGALDTALPGKIGARLVRTFGKETAEAAARRLLLYPVKPKFLITTGRGTVVGMSTEALTEGMQEAVGGITAAWGADKPIAWGDLGQQVLEASVAGAIAGGVFEGGTEAVRFRREEARWIAAKQQEEFFKSLGKGVVSSELLQKLPEEGRKWISNAVKDGPIEQVYVPVQQWEEYWQKKGESPHLMAQAVTGEREALDLAKESKTGLLPIPTEQYATKLAGTAHHDFFVKEVKLRPDLANLREVEEANARAERLISQAKLQAQREHLTAVETIKGKLVEMWVERGASRYQARKWADLHGPRYVERARRLGRDPVKTFEADPRVVFYSLASGAPLVPTPPRTAAAPGQPVPEVATDPIAALPETVMSDAREETLDLAFRTVTAEPTDKAAGITLDEHGFTPDEVAALELAGLATGGRMVRGQFADYLEIRGARRKAAEAAAMPTLPDLPESPAPEGETAAERARRQGVHVAALTSMLTREAQKLDPTVTGEVIRAELDRRLEFEADQADAVRASGRGQALLRAIAGYGGVWYSETTGGEKDEVLFYAREGRDVKDRSERGGRSAEQYEGREWDVVRTGEAVRGVVPTWNGVAGVFRADGNTPDDMATLLQQDGEFANIDGPNALLNAIDLALRARPDRDVLPGTADLARLGIDPALRWWDDQWGVDPALVSDEGDISFDPTEFEQRLPFQVYAMQRGRYAFEDSYPTREEAQAHIDRAKTLDTIKRGIVARRAEPQEFEQRVGTMYPVRESRLQRARRGDRVLVSIDAATFRDLWEQQHPNESLPWHPGRIQNLRALEAVDAYPIVTVNELGTVDVTDGRHRLSLAAERGQRIPVAIEPGTALPAALDPEVYEDPALPEEFWQRKAPPPIPASVEEVAGFAGMAEAVKQSGRSMRRIPLKRFMQQRVQEAFAAAGLPATLDPADPRVQNYLVEALTNEGLAALTEHTDAVGWYDIRVRQARAIAALVHPELATDDNAWFVFTYALAVLSNGTPVNENFSEATRAYKVFKKKGKLPTNMGRGQPAKNVNKQLFLFNKEVAERGGVEGGGLEKFRTFLMQRFKTADLKRLGYKHVAALADEDVFGALILGPKIGNGFWLNLNGVFSQFTMDRWWSRTWGRLTGTLIYDTKAKLPGNRERLQAGIRALDADERLLLESLVGDLSAGTVGETNALARRISKAAANQATLPPLTIGRLDEVRLAANTLVDNLLLERETPKHNTERFLMTTVARRALANIQAAGYPGLTPADFQALLWYPEKRLYETARAGKGVSKYEEDAAPDYANAAANFARANNVPDDAIQAARDREAAATRRRDLGGRRPAAAAGRAGDLRPALTGGLRAGGRQRPALRARRRRGVDDGEFYQLAAPVSATLVGFYSRLTLPVRDAKVEKAKGRDWKAIIRAAKTGINLDEYQAVGVETLDDGTTYTRAEVLDFLKAHELHIETVELANPDEFIDPEMLQRETERIHAERVEEWIDEMGGRGHGPPLLYAGDIKVKERRDGDQVAYEWTLAGERVSWDEYDTREEAEAAAQEELEARNETIERDWVTDMSNTISWDLSEIEARKTLREQYRDRETHYSSWVLQGARDGSYREVFITAPYAGEGQKVRAQRAVIEDAIKELTASVSAATPEFETDFEVLDILQRLLDGGNYNITLGRDFVALTQAENDMLARSGGVPGLVQAVFQAGLTNLPTNWIDGHPGYEHIKNPIVRLRFNLREVPRAEGGVETVLFLEEIQPPVKEPRAGLDEFSQMPEVFQKNWRELAMRFALQHAATHGYDRVAWTNGQTQVDRYGLRGVADNISYYPANKRLVARQSTQYGQDTLLDKRGVNEDDIRRFIGDEEAARLLTSPALMGTADTYFHINGRNVEVGGEGLMRLYDKQFGEAANKLPAMRRSTVSTTTMDLPGMIERAVYTGPSFTVEQLKEFAAKDRSALKPGAVGAPGQPMGSALATQALNVAKDMEQNRHTFPAAMAVHGSDALARWLGGSMAREVVPMTVPGIIITPPLRETLLNRGQEFFQPKKRRPLGNEPYTHDLFGNPLPKPPDPLAPEMPTRVEMVTTAHREIGISWVHSATDAATAMAYLARGAQERFDGLLTDDNGTPLALIGGFKGRVDRTAPMLDTLLAEALSVPGATRLWLAHNHPSGNPTLSDGDRAGIDAVQRIFANSGIEVEGILAIGGGLGPRPQYSFARPGRDPSMDEVGEAREPSSPMRLPVQERELVAVDKLDSRDLFSPAVVAAVAPQIAKGRFGIIFLDAHFRATNFVPLDPKTATALKDQERAKALYQTWAKTASNKAYIFAENPRQARAAVNVARALTDIGITVIDIVDPNGLINAPRDVFLGEFTMPLEPPSGEGPPGYGDVRGSFNRLRGWIRLVAGAEDLSTFLHESGHAFLHELMSDALEVSVMDPAQQTDLQKGLVNDAHVVLRWFGFEGTIGDFLALSTDQQREMHEKWARAFEVYLYTGQAPSAELRSVFATFRAWLITVYRVLLGTGPVTQQDFEAALSKEAGFEVKLAPEIKQVMDRLLASDEAIAAAREEGQIVPLYSDQATAGVDALTWAAYQKAIEEAHIKARETLDARLLAEWRREQGVEWQRQREQVREQVVNEMNQNAVAVALSVIRTGKLPDGSIPSFGDGQPFKLSKRAIVNIKGEAFLKRLPRPYLYTVTGGLHPDAVAELVGFTSGDAMLDALVDANPPKATIEAETDRRMREEHGDALLDGLELKELAEQALHDHRAEIISAELKALTKEMTAASVPTAAALNEAAERRVSQMPFREVSPGLFLQAATRAGQKAFDAFARNDRAAAVQFKIDELSTLALYRAAAKAKDRAQKTATLLGQFQTSPGRRKNLLRAGSDYLDQVDALLERYEFTKTTQRAIERRESLRKWIEKQQQDGLPINIPDWVIDDTRRINYTRLTIDELDGLRAAVDNIAHLARLKNKLVDARDQRELAEVRAEIAASIYANNTQRAEVLEPRVGLAYVKNASAGILYSHRKLASIVRQLDGFEDGGPMWSYVMRRVNEAGNKEAVMNGAATTALIKLFEQFYRPGERANFNVKRRTKELDVAGRKPRSLSKQALLMMALNQGNDTNRQRLRETYGWTQEQVQQALDVYLDKRDWDFVQATWDYIETYWPQIVDKQTRVAGAVPEKVQATPVFTRHGEYRGGYFPIAYDSEQSGKQQSLELASAADLAKAAAYVHATTNRGHLERRVEGSIKRPVRLDFGVIHEHLGKVIHDLTHHEMLIDVGRIVAPEHEVGQAIVATAGPRAYEQITRALRDIALGPAPARHEGEHLLGWLARGSTVVGLGWNVMSASLQWIGYTQTIQRIGWRWAMHGLGSFLRGALPMQQGVKAIYAESEMMRARYKQHSQELHDVRERLGIYSGFFSGWVDAGLRTVSANRVTKQAMADSYLTLIGKAQQMVDVPTYLGAKAKAMADKQNLKPDGTIDEAKCIALAEQAVLDAQGGGQLKDLAAIQRGGGAFKVWINFYSFFNVTYQLAVESVRKNGGKLRVNPANPIAVGRLLVDCLLLFVLPTALVHVVRSLARGDLGEELEEPEELAWTLAKENLSFALGMFVIVREFAPLLEAYGKYEGPAGTRGIGTVGKAVDELRKIEWSEWSGDEGVRRALLATGGVLFHFPAAQVDKSWRGIEALMSGEEEDWRVAFFGPPPKRR